MTSRTCARRGCDKPAKPQSRFCGKRCSIDAQKQSGGAFYSPKAAAANAAARKLGISLQEYYARKDPR